MVEQKKQTPGRGGSIITMSSVNALLAIPTAAGYNAAKGGVSSLTRCCVLATRRAEGRALHLQSMYMAARVTCQRHCARQVHCG